MELLFLGTSSGTPTKTRNVTGLALMEDQGRAWCLIDCGEGTQHQLLHTPLSVNDLQAIFVTHVHGDHCYGLPGLLASAGLNGRKSALTIVAPKGIQEWLESTMVQTQLGLPFELNFLRAESLRAWICRNLIIDSIELSHRVRSFAYSFAEASTEASLNIEKLTSDAVPQGPLWGQLKKGIDVEFEGRVLKSADYVGVTRRARKIIVGGDNDSPALLSEACKGCDVLVHEATYTRDILANKADENLGHSSANLVASFAQSAAIPNLVLTHFSARYQSNPDQSPSMVDIENEAIAVYRGNLFLAKDFARYRLDKSGALQPVDKQ